MSEHEERTMPATPRRLEEARARGQVARSAELSAAAALLASVLALELFGGSLLGALADQMRGTFSTLEAEGDPLARVSQALEAVALAAAPIAITVLVVVAGVGLLQTGFLFTFGPMAPDASRLAPQLGRLFSPSRALSGVLKLAVLGGVLAVTLAGAAQRLSVDEPAAAAGRLALTLALRSSIALLVLGAADYALRRWQRERALRMTPREASEEARQHEGDPEVRARRREQMRRAAHESVRASVVLAAPGGEAVALAYDPATMAAPRVVGRGRLELVARANEQGVPVVERPEAEALWRRAVVGGGVPAESVRAVADAVAWAMAVRGGAP